LRSYPAIMASAITPEPMKAIFFLSMNASANVLNYTGAF
jgi:hypothetical protein